MTVIMILAAGYALAVDQAYEHDPVSLKGYDGKAPQREGSAKLPEDPFTLRTKKTYYHDNRGR